MASGVISKNLIVSATLKGYEPYTTVGTIGSITLNKGRYLISCYVRGGTAWFRSNYLTIPSAVNCESSSTYVGIFDITQDGTTFEAYNGSGTSQTYTALELTALKL